MIEDQERDMQWLVDWLRDPGNARSAADFPLEGEEARAIGVYAWHGDDLANELVRRRLGWSGTGPLYLGRCSVPLNTRIVRDDLRNARASVFRRSLAALLWEELGLRSPSPHTLDTRSEERLTEWMHEHLSVTIVPTGERAVGAMIEDEARPVLDPPLNLTKVRSAPARTRLRKLRSVHFGPFSQDVDHYLVLEAALMADPRVVIPITRASGRGSRRSRMIQSRHPAGAGRERGA